MNIHESAEDYLEAILRLKEAKGYARSVDISLLLGVTKPSVSVAMKRLREKLGDKEGNVIVTVRGIGYRLNL